MHIADGFVSLPVAFGGMAVTVAGTAYGLSKLDSEQMPKVAAMASAFFVGSLIHIPVGAGCSAHLVLSGLAGLVLGPMVFPALLVGLLLQAVFFEFGGLLSLGINTMNMALPGLLVYFVFRRLLRISVKPRLVFCWGFAAGSIAVLLSCLMLVACLSLSSENAWPVAFAVLLVHLPIFLLEGLLSGTVVVFLKKVKPELFFLSYRS
ncbi:MAG: hypothetical protein A2X49_11040 [Lentisphaerae bacterium GWF2_52_8]|nr:MAG: hypothetical protein A2X49_11040 [Lentisphaerae bacterium GWF2_52_8]